MARGKKNFVDLFVDELNTFFSTWVSSICDRRDYDYDSCLLLRQAIWMGRRRFVNSVWEDLLIDLCGGMIDLAE